jgi:hypothetical protein
MAAEIVTLAESGPAAGIAAVTAAAGEVTAAEVVGAPASGAGERAGG